MPGLLDRARMAIARRIAPPARQDVPKDRPPGGFSFGTQWFGGSQYTDAFQARRAPSPWKLIENHKALIFALVARNRDAVVRIPLRLYADGSRAQGKPSRACDPAPVSRARAARFVEGGQVSSSAVDRIYEVRNHPILDVIDNPDGRHYFSRKKLIGLLVSMMDVLGSGFLVPDGRGWDWTTGAAGGGPPEFLWVIYPQYTIPVRYPGTPFINYWQYFKDKLPFESVLWFRQSISLRDPYGAAYSPTYAGDTYQDQEQRMIAIADQLLGQGPRPNVVFSPKDPMFPPGEPERKRFEQDLNRRHSGGNAGGALVTDGAWDVTPVNQPPADTSWRDLSAYDRDCLASLFGVPPTFFTVDTNLANLQAADEQHARNGVEPRCDAIAEVFTDLVRRWDPRLFFRFDPAIQEDSESKEKVISMRLASGRTTINQENEEDRWPPVPWGEEPWFPGTLKQPSMLKEQHELGIEQGQAAMESQEKRDEFELRDEPDDDEGARRALLVRLDRLRERIAG